MKLHVLIGGNRHELDVQRSGGGLAVTLGDETYLVDVAQLADGAAYSLLIDERSLDVAVEERGDALDLLIGGTRYVTEVLGEREWLARSIQAEQGGGDATVRAVMTGIVTEMRVAAGDTVEPGQVIFILEAMKMENEVKAEVGGTVSKVAVAAGDTVELGDVIVEIDAAE